MTRATASLTPHGVARSESAIRRLGIDEAARSLGAFSFEFDSSVDGVRLVHGKCQCF